PMAVVTNKPLLFSEAILEKLGVRGCFQTISGGDSGMPLKPAPDAFKKIMADRGILQQDTVIVGDGTTDVRGGKAAGAMTCAVTYGFRSEELLRREGPDYIINQFSELVGLFAP
ncbi:MAG TPA: HAD family hydrolase, partial [Nitrospirota bacterium]